MDGDAERFQQGTSLIADCIWNRETVARADVHALAQGAIFGEKPIKVVIRAEIGMTMLAEFTAPARHMRLDRHALTDLQGLMVAVKRILADCRDLAYEFMSENGGLADPRVANLPGLVHVQIAAAKAHGFDLEA